MCYFCYLKEKFYYWHKNSGQTTTLSCFVGALRYHNFGTTNYEWINFTSLFTYTHSHVSESESCLLFIEKKTVTAGGGGESEKARERDWLLENESKSITLTVLNPVWMCGKL